MQIKHTTPTHRWVSNPFLVVIISLTISPVCVQTVLKLLQPITKKEVLHNLQQNIAFTINNNTTVGVAALPTLS